MCSSRPPRVISATPAIDISIKANTVQVFYRANTTLFRVRADTTMALFSYFSFSITLNISLAHFLCYHPLLWDEGRVAPRLNLKRKYVHLESTAKPVHISFPSAMSPHMSSHSHNISNTDKWDIQVRDTHSHHALDRSIYSPFAQLISSLAYYSVQLLGTYPNACVYVVSIARLSQHR